MPYIEKTPGGVPAAQSKSPAKRPGFFLVLHTASLAMTGLPVSKAGNPFVLKHEDSFAAGAKKPE